MTARDRIIILVVALVGAVGAFWMLVIQPKRQQATKLTAQVSTLQSQLSTARGTIAAGLSARAQFASDYTQLARLGEALPSDDNVPSLIYQIQNAASAARVDFHSLQMAGSGSSSSSSSSTAGASTLPPGAALGPAGLPIETFNFTFNGDFFHLANFFHRLDEFVVAGNNTIDVRGRLMSVNGISFAAGASGFPSITATVSATTYMAPATTGLLDGATSSGPAGTTSTGSSTTGAATASATITPNLR